MMESPWDCKRWSKSSGRLGLSRPHAGWKPAIVCPAGAGFYRDGRFPTGAVTPTVAVGQVRSVRAGRERADGKRSTEGKQMGSEAGCVGAVASNTKARTSPKTHQVEPRGANGKKPVPTW